jgi:predicted component of type VI protein secretion system
MISRRHCEIFEVDGLLMIRDLESLNGTVVAGQRVYEAPLRPDEEFTVGPITFRVVYDYDGDLDSVPEPKLVDEQTQQPEIQFAEQLPEPGEVQQTPSCSPADAPGSQTAEPATEPTEPVDVFQESTLETLPRLSSATDPDANQTEPEEKPGQDTDDDLDNFLKRLQ